MKRIAIAGLAGWTGIAGLAWWLADRRLELCRYSSGYTCELRATAARDDVLIWGLGVALLAILLFLAAAHYARSRGSGNLFPASTPTDRRRRPVRVLGAPHRHTFTAQVRETTGEFAAWSKRRLHGPGKANLPAALIVFAVVSLVVLGWLEPGAKSAQPAWPGQPGIFDDLIPSKESKPADPYDAISVPVAPRPDPYVAMGARPVRAGGAPDPYVAMGARPVATRPADAKGRGARRGETGRSAAPAHPGASPF